MTAEKLRTLSHVLMWLSIILPLLGGMAACARYYVDRYERQLSEAVVERRNGQLRADLSRSTRELSELRKRASPRRLTPEQRKVMHDVLAPFKGESVALACKLLDPESSAFAEDIGGVFREAGWHVHPLIRNSLNDSPYLVVFCNTNKTTLPAYGPIMRALAAAGLDRRPEQVKNGSIATSYPEVVHIIVGSKPS